jgi:type I restriction enzyme S subunit
VKWQLVPLGELAQVDRSGIAPENIQSGTTYVGLENISEEGTFTEVRSVSNGELASTKFAFTRKHILYGKLRPYLRKIARPEFDGVCSTDILPILPGSKVSRDYLAHFLRIDSSVSFAVARSVGVNLPRISPNILVTLRIPLPPMEEQRRIAAILDQAEALRAKRRQALAKLDTLTQSLFLEMFGDPTQSVGKWPIVRFGDIADCKLGKMLDSSKQTGTATYTYLRNANVQWNRLELDSLLTMDFDESDRKKFALKAGDLLICEGGEPGRAALWNGELTNCFYQKALHRCRIKPGKGLSKFFVFLFWEMAKRKSLQYSTSTIGHLTAEKLDELKVPNPPLEIQQLFVSKVRAIEEEVVIQRRSQDHLESFFGVLQHRAFRGEL